MLEYSTNVGSWHELESYAITNATQSWQTYSIELSALLATDATQFRWRQKSHSGANWDQWALDNISIAGSSHPKYSEVVGQYFYGNGDYYDFTGVVSDQYGGGSFSAGQKIYAGDESKDSFVSDVNETGNIGYYVITEVANKFGVKADSLLIGDYFDSETGLTVLPFSSITGTKGLGSESGFLSSRKTAASDLISNYHEADVFSHSLIEGRYFYGNGDYYSFTGSITSDFGGGSFKVGEKIFATTSIYDAFDKEKNETGNTGYYLIDTVANKIGSTGNSIVIQQYYDSESAQLASVSSATAGTQGLGSETAFLTSANSDAKDLINNFNEADLDTHSIVQGRYFYGNGDYYSFSGAIGSDFGGGSFKAGEKIYASSSANDAFDKDKNDQIDRSCKACNNGTLSLKNSFRGGAFIGCSNYPECKFTRPLSKSKASQMINLSEPKLIGKNDSGKDIFLKNGRFGPYLQYEKVLEENIEEEKPKKRKKTKKKKPEVNELLKNVSIPKGIELESIDLEKAKFLCSLPKSLGINPENQKEITLNTGRFGPYLKCENKSARIENVDEIFSIGLNRAITLIAEAKPGRMSSSIIKDLGEHPEDKKPVRIMKGQYGPYIKYKSLNATIPEEKDPTEITMEEALILIEKRREYDKNKKQKKRKAK